MKTNGKNIFFQIMKALCYYALFMGAQVIVGIASSFLGTFSYMAKNGVGTSPDDQEKLQAFLLDFVNQNTGYLVIAYTLLALLILWIFFLIRRKKLHGECGMLRFKTGYLPAILVLAVGLTFFCNTALNLLPEAWLDSYGEASGSLSQGPFFVMLIATGICAPLLEEITFRGLILSRLTRALPLWVSVCISSLLFGISHGHPLWIVYTFLLGVAFSVVALRTGSILPTMLMHAIFNIFGTCIGYVEFEFNIIIFFTMLIAGIILTILGFYMLLNKKQNVPALNTEE